MAQGLLGGVLPAIYSGADQLKRGVYGLLTNPQEQFARASQSLLQSHNERQALMKQAFADPTNPTKVTDPQALAQLGNDVLAGELGIAPVGMIAYHGTPHTIQGKFDISKVGTGEGAQAYGHGMYFAESPAVAESYKAAGETLKYKPTLEKFTNGPNYYIDDAGNYLKVRDWVKNDTPVKVPKEEYLQKFAEVKAIADKQPQGNLYKVDIPDEHIPMMLDWDKPLSQQPQIIEKLKNLGQDELNKLGINPDFTRKSTGKELTGESLYDVLTTFNSQKGASKILANQGITGIRYLDQGSRGTTGGQIIDVFKDSDGWKSKVKVENRGGAGFMSPTQIVTTSMPFKTEKEAKKWAEEKIGSGTSNFVVFDPTDVKILERNNQPVEGLLDFNNPKDFAKVQKTLGKDATEFEVAQKIAQKNAALPLEEGGLGLPKNNTSADRAKAMGFETPVYHGTNADINAFNVEGKGKTSGAGAFVTTNPTAAETYVSASGDGNILPLLMRKEDFLTANARGRNWADIWTNQLGTKSKGKRYTPEELGLDINSATSTDELGMIAKELGLSGAEIKNVRDLGPNSHVMRAKQYLQEKYGITPDTSWSNITGEQFAEAQDFMKKFYESQKADIYALQDPSLLRSRFAAFDPARKGETGILAGMLPFGLLTSEDDK